ncbi:two-component system vancomycin resistance associated response regulator VraR [Hydrogenispora ethanolica]|uniref:Two-component system vancomycin resistance associated response regulator VraR n=1 Tax=Hydrogenispora ethanolica TaxID=1082276 RepID=A0A4R1S4I2_HYDET|nr:response regulator transcription factor [Hydrogenispora ethanolica]TCL74166.1 two-component system vancomycin resistance associated response regulator VraR [Hydrogenispora ethanolica]
MSVIRVVVAEDMAVLREYFTGIINENEDMKVVGEAGRGEEVFAILETVEADVLLTDIEMAERFDGIRTAEILRRIYPQLRVVFLTVHEDNETIFGAYEAGAIDYVFKTAPAEEIVESIRLAHQNRSPIRPEVADKIRSEFSRIRKNESDIINAVNIMSLFSQSEREIIKLLIEQRKIREIARIRCVEVSTIKSQIGIILRKCNMKRTKNLVQLIESLNLQNYFKLR